MKTITITGIEAGEAVNEFINWNAGDSAQAQAGEALQDAAVMALGDDFWESEESFDWTVPTAMAEVVREALLDAGVQAGMADYAEHAEERRIERD